VCGGFVQHSPVVEQLHDWRLVVEEKDVEGLFLGKYLQLGQVDLSKRLFSVVDYCG